jgi:tetratricopeptide (TPR) repeat protein
VPMAGLPDLSIVLTFLREGQRWSQAELAAAAGFSAKLVSAYERGWKNLTRSRLESLIAFMGLPPERIDATLETLAENREASRAPANPGASHDRTRRKIKAISKKVGRLASGGTHSILTLLTDGAEALHSRQQAEQLWARLKRRSPEEQALLLEESGDHQTWALCERVAAESVTLAANHPRKALELAELALAIAARVPGEQTWRWRLEGYSRGHVSNARRALQELPVADAALAQAWKLWEAGAPGDRGLLNEAWLHSFEANLRRAQRRFPEALKSIERALAVDDGELRGKILISKANILKVLGNAEGSTATLEQAAPLVDAIREPRLALVLRFNLLEDLCQVGRAEEAAPRLAEVRMLAERLGEPLDLARVVWLSGKVAAGLGRTVEALAAFEQVRQEFRHHQLAYDAALVHLDLSLLLLDEGRTGEVRQVAEEMLWIFNAQGVQREALAALQVFYEAARRETATAELARRVFHFLRRAELDPGLRFAEEGDEAS